MDYKEKIMIWNSPCNCIQIKIYLTLIWDFISPFSIFYFFYLFSHESMCLHLEGLGIFQATEILSIYNFLGQGLGTEIC